jgi:hypothetical protein
MRILVIILLCSASLQASPESKLIYWGGIAEQQKGEQTGRIRGGDFPFLANLRIQSKRDQHVGIGSGGLVAESWVITAKHVVEGFLQNPAAYTFKVTFPDGTVRNAIEGFGHEERDIAIVKLDQKVDDIPIPSLHGAAIPSLVGKDGFAMTITGANGSFIAYDVIGYSDGVRLFSPDILRGGDSGAPVVGLDPKGNPVILGTLIGPYPLSNGRPNPFFGNMSYAQFSPVCEVRSWIAAQIPTRTAIKWENWHVQKMPAVPVSIYRGTPEFQLNQAIYLYLNGRLDEAKQIALELSPELKGRIYEVVAKELVRRCDTERDAKPK